MEGDKKTFGNDNPNQRVYHTQEGTKYYLRRAVQRIPQFDGTIETPAWMVGVFNPDNSLESWLNANLYTGIGIENALKPVIPIMLSYQAIKAVPNAGTQNYDTLCNYQLPYYVFQDNFSPGVQSGIQGLKALTKMMPLIDLIEADPSVQTIAYNCRYDRAVFVDDDFIEIQGSAAFIFGGSAANAFNGLPNQITIANTAVIATISLLYFELQK